MSSKDASGKQRPATETSSSATAPQQPSLPPNVSIFTPRSPAGSRALLEGRIFTRLTVSSQTKPVELAESIGKNTKVNDSFCLIHQNVVLVFDAEKGDAEGACVEKDVKDAHHEHVRMACLALKDADMSLDIAGCVFDSAEALQAGFQFDRLSSGSVMVIDLMNGDEDSDDDSDLEGILAGGDVVQ